MRRWKVYRRVLLSGSLSREAEGFLTKQGLTRVPGLPGYYNWNTRLEAATAEEAQLLMEQRLENLLTPYDVEYSTTKTVLTPEKLTPEEIEEIGRWLDVVPRSETWRNPPGSR